MRIWVLHVIFVCLILYTWKDWFRSFCALLLLTAFMQDEDMPRAMLGLQGLNPWNMLLLSILLSWIIVHRRRAVRWDMPPHVNVLLVLYLGVIVLGFLRAVFDRSYLHDYPLGSLFSDELINTVKWALPGILLFDGCRSRRQVVLVLSIILVVYVLFAAQTVYRVPWSSAISIDEIGRAHV